MHVKRFILDANKYLCSVLTDKVLNFRSGNSLVIVFFLLALQTPLGVVFYSPLAGFSLLAYEVPRSHTTTRHSR